METLPSKSVIYNDKTIADKFMYIPNEDTQNVNCIVLLNLMIQLIKNH